jgi:polyisoprenoid-binding protein YceI
MCVRTHFQRLTEEQPMSTTRSTPTRTVDGVLLPAPGVWEIDPGHADVSFVGRHFMLTKVRGRFTEVKGAVTITEDLAASTLDVTIGMASVESGSQVRDDHIRSADLFDVERFPEATFRSVEVSWRGDEGVVNGDLTIHGVTRRVPLQVRFEGYATDLDGADRAVFSAHTRVSREDFGVTWNVALETGGVLVSNEIRIEIEVETVLSRA